ncbi:MAG: 5-formyltetrahydrofolate cyclo-ligase [Candidatus Omnitrophica bacterium]|nr:5-formyltetrahydrofolate cyclo-ligase [Candidatus Omnitrophota bacterium]
MFVQQTKQAVRKRILDLIHRQREEEALNKSQVVGSKLLELLAFQKSKTILFYCSFKGEVNTFPMMEKAIELKKRVAVPFIMKETKQIMVMLIESTKELIPGSYGIPEPQFDAARVIDPAGLDLVLVPGVAFDKDHNRLGRGAGYYDRFLSELPSTIPTVGLAYDFQLVPAIPGLEPHDRPVTLVLTS